MSTPSSARLYGRVALLRRQILLRQLIERTIAGALAVAALIVAAGLATYALFLTIRAPFGDLGATLAIAALYLAAAIILLVYTTRETSSPNSRRYLRWRRRCLKRSRLTHRAQCKCLTPQDIASITSATASRSASASCLRCANCWRLAIPEPGLSSVGSQTELIVCEQPPNGKQTWRRSTVQGRNAIVLLYNKRI